MIRGLMPAQDGLLCSAAFLVASRIALVALTAAAAAAAAAIVFTTFAAGESDTRANAYCNCDSNHHSGQDDSDPSAPFLLARRRDLVGVYCRFRLHVVCISIVRIGEIRGVRRRVDDLRGVASIVIYRLQSFALGIPALRSVAPVMIGRLEALVLSNMVGHQGRCELTCRRRSGCVRHHFVPVSRG